MEIKYVYRKKKKTTLKLNAKADVVADASIAVAEVSDRTVGVVCWKPAGSSYIGRLLWGFGGTRIDAMLDEDR